MPSEKSPAADHSVDESKVPTVLKNPSDPSNGFTLALCSWKAHADLYESGMTWLPSRSMYPHFPFWFTAARPSEYWLTSSYKGWIRRAPVLSTNPHFPSAGDS